MVLRMESLDIELAEPGPSLRTVEPHVGLRIATRITDYVGAPGLRIRGLTDYPKRSEIRHHITPRGDPGGPPPEKK